ncbi:MAG: cell wall hydrolase [Hyphomonadaceae bacterium]
MSDVEKRQAQQRALGAAACAAVFAVGGPLVAYRAELRNADEAYKSDAFILAKSLNGQSHSARLAKAEAAPVGASGLRQRQSFIQSVSHDTRPGATYMFDLTPTNALYQPARFQPEKFKLDVKLTSFTDKLLDRAVDEKSEFQCLAEAVYYEARSESTRGQMAVAEVVMNRVGDPNFPDSICKVVYQGHYRVTGCQFTFTCDGSLRFKPRGLAWDRARAVALHVRLGFAKPVTNHATHYHTDYVDPYWAPGLVETKRIGTHIFYRFPQSKREWTNARLALAAYEQHREAERALAAQTSEPTLIDVATAPTIGIPTDESIAL